MSSETLRDRQALLERIAEPGVDIERAAQRVAATRSGRRRRRRNRSLVVGGAAALIALGLVAALVGSGDGDEVVADAARSTTTTEPVEDEDADDERSDPTEPVDGEADAPEELDPSVLEALPVEPAPERPPAMVTPDPPPPPAPAPLPVPPPAADEPLVVELRPPTGPVTAGEAVAVEVAWLDADHVGGAPMIRVDWGDPLLQPSLLGPEQLDCRGAGRPSGAVERAEVRFASPGPRTVRVEVIGCDGPSGTQQRTVTESAVVVAAPTHGAGPARTVVAHTAPGVALPGPLDHALATFRSEGVPVVGLGQRRPTLDQRAADGAATVLVIPGGAAGRVELTWPGQRCRATADLAAAPPGSARLVPLALVC